MHLEMLMEYPGHLPDVPGSGWLPRNMLRLLRTETPLLIFEATLTVLKLPQMRGLRAACRCFRSVRDRGLLRDTLPKSGTLHLCLIAPRG